MPTTPNGQLETEEEIDEEEEDTRERCQSCDDPIEAGSERIFDGETYCETCYIDQTFECEDCHDRFDRDNGVYIEDASSHVCEECAQSDRYFECDDCSNMFTRDSAPDPENDQCSDCHIRENGNRTSYPRNANFTSTELQSIDPGKIIKSSRRFGIELETVYNKPQAIAKLGEKINRAWGFHGDGSIRTNKDAINGIEMVSPVMAGKKGEQEILLLTENARKCGFFVNTSCGYHLHLESLDFKRDPKKDRFVDEEGAPSHIVVYRWKWGGDNNFEEYGETENIQDIPRDQNNDQYKYEIITRPVNKQKIPINDGEEFLKLRDLWYVYIVFDDVFRGMQPPSRRNNSFCKATSSLYSLEAIRELRDFNELEFAWYKVDKRYTLQNRIRNVSERKGSTKDATRYCGFNLAPILSKYGKTIEIRYHSPTLNSDKILYWADIHQTIFDRVSAGEFDASEINRVHVTETHVLKKAQAMCRIFGISKDTEEYITDRLHKFNKLNATNDEMADDEVSESDTGRPNSYHTRDGSGMPDRPRRTPGLERMREIEEREEILRREMSRARANGVLPEVRRIETMLLTLMQERDELINQRN